MFRSDFQEERATRQPDSKLQAVFSKLSGVFPRAGDLGGAKTMSSDIIESVLADSPIPPPQQYPFELSPVDETDLTYVAVRTMTKRLERELRAAKKTHLYCGEVLLPCGLLQRIARDIVGMAESEPCGLRGCILYIHFEGDGVYKQLSSFKCDPATATTFELYLTFKQAENSWNSFLPQFLKNLTRGNTLMISPAYTLSKNKLYRSYVD